MSAPDASVWSGEAPKHEANYWVTDTDGTPPVVCWCYPDAVTPWHAASVRSILPVPSAERHAALEAVAAIVREHRDDLDHMAFLLDAALARLEATR